MENKKPILAITDLTSDLGRIAKENKFGFWSLYGDLEKSMELILEYHNNPYYRKDQGVNSYNFLLENYTVSKSYDKINLLLTQKL